MNTTYKNNNLGDKWVGYALTAAVAIIAIVIDFAGNYVKWYMPVMQLVAVASALIGTKLYYDAPFGKGKLWQMVVAFLIAAALVWFSSFPAYDGKW